MRALVFVLVFYTLPTFAQEPCPDIMGSYLCLDGNQISRMDVAWDSEQNQYTIKDTPRPVDNVYRPKEEVGTRDSQEKGWCKDNQYHVSVIGKVIMPKDDNSGESEERSYESDLTFFKKGSSLIFKMINYIDGHVYSYGPRKVGSDGSIVTECTPYKLDTTYTSSVNATDE